MTTKIKGWCPGAYRPMMSGDGLVVRIRPRLGRFGAKEIGAICHLANAYGNGLIELTNRANLQLRGVREESHVALLDDLAALGVLDDDPTLESRRNILVTPFWQSGDLTCRLTKSLIDRLAELPSLPAKFGFAIDTGPVPVLAKDSADIRLERGDEGDLMLRADGASLGQAVTEAEAIDGIIMLANWFARKAPDATTRMNRLLQNESLPEEWTAAAIAPEIARPEPGQTQLGQLVGIPFGQIEASALAEVLSPVSAVRTTPWRLLLLEGAAGLFHDSLISKPDDPLLNVDACPGAPRCGSAAVETRGLARQLAPRVKGSLHVSGCAKGCARSNPADLTLVGGKGVFDIIRNGNAQACPERAGLTPADILTEMT
ncbi:MAG: cobalamin biosynthesis protein CobG [Paracoccaceae bacterium]